MVPSAESLVQAHLDALYGLARAWTRDGDLAKELTHRAFLKAFEKRGQLRNPEAARAWLIAILRNEMMSEFRQRRIEVELDEEMPGYVEDPVDLECDEAMLFALPAAVNGLPDGMREILLLRFQQELSYEDISRILGLPMGTVMSRLHRAKAALRESLEGRRTTGLPLGGGR